MERMPLVQNILSPRVNHLLVPLYSQKTSFSFSFLFFLFSFFRGDGWLVVSFNGGKKISNIPPPAQPRSFDRKLLGGLDEVFSSLIGCPFSRQPDGLDFYGSYETREPKIVWKKWLKDHYQRVDLREVDTSSDVEESKTNFSLQSFIRIFLKSSDNLSKKFDASEIHIFN